MTIEERIERLEQFNEGFLNGFEQSMRAILSNKMLSGMLITLMNAQIRDQLTTWLAQREAQRAQTKTTV